MGVYHGSSPFFDPSIVGLESRMETPGTAPHMEISSNYHPRYDFA